MNLQIRDPRARELAEKLAKTRNVSMTQAVLDALESELAREREKRPLEERVAALTEALWAEAKPGGRDMTKDEIDAMWGHD